MAQGVTLDQYDTDGARSVHPVVDGHRIGKAIIVVTNGYSTMLPSEGIKVIVLQEPKQGVSRHLNNSLGIKK